MKAIHTLTEAKIATDRLVTLEKLMDRAQNAPNAFKRTLGCPGSRYLPEWEEIMKRLTAWLGRKTTPNADIEAQGEYEEKLRNA